MRFAILENIIEILKNRQNLRITEKKLRELVSEQDYNRYFAIVTDLVKNSIISPVKRSGSNGRIPPLYKRYTIAKQEDSHEDVLPYIRLLHEAFNIEGYLLNPDKYREHGKWLITLDKFMKSENEALKTPLSINERSFDIFNMEKALRENRIVLSILKFNPGLRERLNFYETPEPFFIYNINRAERTNVLIIENKDTWYTVKNCMNESLNSIYGIRFDSLIYGEGRKISRKIDSLTEFDKSFFQGSKTTYYYFGDLDYEGIGIAKDVIRINPGLEIRLMKQLYIDMINASKGIDVPSSKQAKCDIKWFVSNFDDKDAFIINELLENGKYIPQEILNNRYFLQTIKEDV